jgi:hypothetical protein
MRSAAVLILLLPLLGGCDRGCGGPAGRAGGAAPSASLQLDLVDCPDGLARCEGGEVMVSRLARIPSTTACPWESLGTCATRCLVEGLVVDLPKARAKPQLCAAPPSAPPAWLPPATESPLFGCEEGEFRCSANVVRRCSGNVQRTVATCVDGCAEVSEGIEADSVDAAAGVLCKRL